MKGQQRPHSPEMEIDPAPAHLLGFPTCIYLFRVSIRPLDSILLGCNLSESCEEIDKNLLLQ